jgi:hypothetical protein
LASRFAIEGPPLQSGWLIHARRQPAILPVPQTGTFPLFIASRDLSGCLYDALPRIKPLRIFAGFALLTIRETPAGNGNKLLRAP